MDNEMLDLYTDFLISSFSYATATSLSRMLDLKVSHDKITRFLSQELYTSKDFWKLTKPLIREFEKEDGAIAIDNTILDKTYTDENEIISWHYDHSKGRNIKGVNIMSCLYCTESTKIPFSFEIIKKDIRYTDEETGKEKRKSSKTMNEIFREMVKNAHRNIKKFKYFLTDNWFSCAENMELINEMQKNFIFALKNNRLIALSYKDKKEGKFKKISMVDLEQNHVYRCYLKGVEFQLLVTKQIFKNKDESEGVLYLVSNDLSLDFNGMTTIYKNDGKLKSIMNR